MNANIVSVLLKSGNMASAPQPPPNGHRKILVAHCNGRFGSRTFRPKPPENHNVVTNYDNGSTFLTLRRLSVPLQSFPIGD